MAAEGKEFGVCFVPLDHCRLLRFLGASLAGDVDSVRAPACLSNLPHSLEFVLYDGFYGSRRVLDHGPLPGSIKNQ